MNIFKWGLAALCLAGVSESASAKDTLVLAPSTKWIVDFATDRCSIVRRFGDDEDAITLKISQFVPTTSLELSLFGDNARLPRNSFARGGRSMPVTVTLGPDTGVSADADASQASTDETKVLVIPTLSFNPKPDDADGPSPDRSFISEEQLPALNQMDQLEFSDSIVRDLVLESGPMADVFKVLDACTFDLMTEIGLDAEANRNRSKGALILEESMRELARTIQRDYPPAALRERRMTILRVRAIVEEDGSVSDCTVMGSMNMDGFGEGICDITRRIALYEPALDADGRPLRSWDLLTIRYRIPS